MESATGKRGPPTTEDYTPSDISLRDHPPSQPGSGTRSSGTSGQGGGRWLDAVGIALSQASGGTWYGSTMELQLASFGACLACRGVRTLRVTVDKRMPLSLWGHDDSVRDCIKAPERRQLPVLRAASVKWIVPAYMLGPVLTESVLLRRVEWMQMTGISPRMSESHATSLTFSEVWKQSEAHLVHSPKTCFERMLTFLDRDGHTMDTPRNPRHVYFPSSLKQLSLACTSFGRMDCWVLPSSLERLALGGDFCQSITSVVWPVSLKHLCLGGFFNQSINDVVWPGSLLQLTLGGCFDQSIADVVFPSTLLQLVFGYTFDQPIVDVVWPVSLLRLALGSGFDQPIANVLWPASLLQLGFGNYFNQAITDVVWPSSLLQLTFGDLFNKPIAEVVWPVSLDRLAFGICFNQPINEVVWPIALQSLKFGLYFDQAVEEIMWPTSLRWLGFGAYYDQELALVRPPNLETVIYTDQNDEHDATFNWPPVQDCFDQPRMFDIEDI